MTSTSSSTSKTTLTHEYSDVFKFGAPQPPRPLDFHEYSDVFEFRAPTSKTTLSSRVLDVFKFKSTSKHHFVFHECSDVLLELLNLQDHSDFIEYFPGVFELSSPTSRPLSCLLKSSDAPRLSSQPPSIHSLTSSSTGTF
jgi:hypothetical protein